MQGYSDSLAIVCAICTKCITLPPDDVLYSMPDGSFIVVHPRVNILLSFFFVFLNFFVLIDCNRSTSWELHHLLESPTNLSPPRKIHGALPSPFKELKYHNIAYF